MDPRKTDRRVPYVCTCKYLNEEPQIQPLQTTAAEDVTEVMIAVKLNNSFKIIVRHQGAENGSAIEEAQ